MAANEDLSAQYEMREQIGKGAFGSAFLILHKETRKQYVLKRIRLAKQTNWQRNSTLQERDMVSKLEHPYIVPHVASWITQGHTVNIVYGYCEKGDLASHVTKNNGAPFPETTLRLWLCEMLLALEYLQVQKVLHRDIKTGNIFLTAAGDVQLGDFGLATYRETEGDRPEDMNLVGTPHYMSPELLSQKGCSFKSDTWSLGCAFYELTAQRPAFNAFNIHGLVTKIRRHRMAPLPAGYSADWGALISLMLTKDPERRPSVQELMAHAALRPDMERARARALELCPALRLPPLLGPWLPAACGSDAGDSGSARDGPSPRASWTEDDSASEPGDPSRRSSCLDGDSPHSTPRGGEGSAGGAGEAPRRGSAAGRPRMLMFDGEALRPDDPAPHGHARARGAPAPGAHKPASARGALAAGAAARGRAVTPDGPSAAAPASAARAGGVAKAGSATAGSRTPQAQRAQPAERVAAARASGSAGGSASGSAGGSARGSAGGAASGAAGGAADGAAAAAAAKEPATPEAPHIRASLDSALRPSPSDPIKMHVRSLQKGGGTPRSAGGGIPGSTGGSAANGGFSSPALQPSHAAAGGGEDGESADSSVTPAAVAATPAAAAPGAVAALPFTSPDLGAEASRQAAGTQAQAQAAAQPQESTPELWPVLKKAARPSAPPSAAPAAAERPASAGRGLPRAAKRSESVRDSAPAAVWSPVKRSASAKAAGAARGAAGGCLAPQRGAGVAVGHSSLKIRMGGSPLTSPRGAILRTRATASPRLVALTPAAKSPQGPGPGALGPPSPAHPPMSPQLLSAAHPNAAQQPQRPHTPGGGGAAAAAAAAQQQQQAQAPGGGDKQQAAHLKKVLALAAALFAKGRMVELGNVLSSPGLAPASVLPGLAVATQRAADAAGGGRSGGSGGSSGGGSGGGGPPQFRLGDTVVVGSHTRTRGVIRWFGPVAFDRADVDYVGIHLELARGRHGGTVAGVRYFDAEPGAAEFIRASKLTPNASGGGAARAAGE